MRYLPTLYPGELIYSYLARYARHLGLPSSGKKLSSLLGFEPSSSIGFPGQLAPLSKKMGWSATGCDTHLVMEHTEFRYWSSTAPVHKCETAMAKMMGSAKGVLSQIGEARTGERSPVIIRYCQVCAEEEIKNLGEAYWHVEHQLCLGGCCLTHRVQLTESVVPRNPIARRSQFIPANDVVKMDNNVAVGTPNSLDVTLCEKSLGALNQGANFFPDPLPSLEGEAVNLARAIVNYFSQTRLHRVGLNPLDGGPNWIRTASNPSLALSPAKRILLDELLRVI